MKDLMLPLVRKTVCNAVGILAAALASANARAVVLYDQNNNASGSGFVSQDFEPANSAFDSQIYDDFIVPATGWTINTVFANGQYFNGPGPAPTVRVQFFSDAGGSPGALINTGDYTVFTDAAGSFTIPIVPLILPGGHYWVSVIAVMDFVPNGQWGWNGRTVQSNDGAQFSNPGGGFGACPTPMPIGNCIPGANPDVLFRLEGDVGNAKRSSGSEKGSVLIFSDVEVKWDGAGAVTQDTFIQLTNDNNLGVDVQMFFINGDLPLAQQPPLPAVATERAHPGWNNVDNAIHLTADQPTYWSVLRGAPGTGGLSPWTILDPGTPPGRPDLDPGAAAGARYLRGFIIAFAVNSANEQIKWNHLSGNATLVNYALGTAAEYNAWAFQAVDPALATGAVVGAPGIIRFNGFEYAHGFDQLLMNFQAVGATAFNGPRLVVSNTDLTLHLLSTDLRENNDGPKTTKAKFDVWNQNEVKFSNAERCITCWYQALLGTWAPNANHFLRANLQTNVGKARIDGAFSPVVCPNLPNNGAWSILGIITSLLIYDGGLANAETATNLDGLGLEDGEIRYDVLGGSPPPANQQDNNAMQPNGNVRPDRNGKTTKSN